MFFRKMAILCLIQGCLIGSLLFATQTECPEIHHSNGIKESKSDESIRVLFTYRTPKNFSKGDTLFLYFCIIDLSREEESKTIVRKISKLNQQVRVKVHLRPTELVFAFVFSKNHPFTSFNRSELGVLKVHKNCHQQTRLKFVEYDEQTGVVLFDPFHLESLNPPL